MSNYRNKEWDMMEEDIFAERGLNYGPREKGMFKNL